MHLDWIASGNDRHTGGGLAPAADDGGRHGIEDGRASRRWWWWFGGVFGFQLRPMLFAVGAGATLPDVFTRLQFVQDGFVAHVPSIGQGDAGRQC